MLICLCIFFYNLDSTESTNNGPSDETRTSNVTENNEQSDIRPPSNTLSDNGSSSESSRYLII